VGDESKACQARAGGPEAAGNGQWTIMVGGRAQDFQQAFTQCDVIAGPVAPTVAWKIGEKSDDPVANYLADIYTLSTSLAGLPGMSVPAGFGAHGMPVGLQLVGNYFDESRLLGVAHQFQQATDWHTRSPEAFA